MLMLSGHRDVGLGDHLQVLQEQEMLKRENRSLVSILFSLRAGAVQ